MVLTLFGHNTVVVKLFNAFPFLHDPYCTSEVNKCSLETASSKTIHLKFYNFFQKAPQATINNTFSLCNSEQAKNNQNVDWIFQKQ